MEIIEIAQFGLGRVGFETLKLAATKPWAKIVGGIDIDPAKIGRSLAELTGVASLGRAKVYESLTTSCAREPRSDLPHVRFEAQSRVRADRADDPCRYQRGFLL